MRAAVTASPELVGGPGRQPHRSDSCARAILETRKEEPHLSELLAVLAIIAIGGQCLYGLRHHASASTLARRLFALTPLRRIDPTRGWGIPHNV
jgi:hypothetical protein